MAEAPFDKPAFNVGMKLGRTINIGDYNSVRFDVSLHAPCYKGEEDAVFDYVKNWVEEKVNGVSEEITEVLSTNG